MQDVQTSQVNHESGRRITQESIIPGAVKQRHLVPQPSAPGDMYYGLDGNSFANLPIGEEGQALTVSGGVPTWEGGASTSGVIALFAGSTAPSGWVKCDGSAISRTTYASLFTVIGTTYGSGDGSTTFNVPNLKGRVAVGLDAAQTEFDALGETGGAKTHTLTTPEIPAHTHTYDKGVADGSNTTGGAGARGTSSTASGSTGGGGAHNNLQPYLVLHYIIKT